jgi:hypothetical protein
MEPRLAVPRTFRQLAEVTRPLSAPQCASSSPSPFSALAGCQQAVAGIQANEAAAAPEAGHRGIHRDNGANHRRTQFSGPDGSQSSSLTSGQAPTGEPLGELVRALRQELPTLDALARGGVQVLAVSGFGPRASVVAFLQDHKIATLKSCQDEDGFFRRARSGYSASDRSCSTRTGRECAIPAIGLDQPGLLG